MTSTPTVMRPGINLAAPAPALPCQPYADEMKAAGPWMSLPNWTEDAHGRPVTTGRLPGFWATQCPVRTADGNPAEPLGNPACVEGRRVLEWMPGAAGHVRLQGLDGTLVTPVPGSDLTLKDGRRRRSYDLVKAPGSRYVTGYVCSVWAEEVGPPAEWVKIHGPGQDPDAPDKFRPDYVASLQGMATLRAVFMLGGNNQLRTDYYWPTAADRTYAGAAPPADAAELAGLVPGLAELWVSFGVNCPPAVVARATTEVLAKLPRSVKLVCEMGNETGWNTGPGFYEQWKVCRDHAHAAGLMDPRRNDDGSFGAGPFGQPAFGEPNAVTGYVDLSGKMFAAALQAAAALGREGDLLHVLGSSVTLPGMTEGLARVAEYQKVPYHWVGVAPYGATDPADSPEWAGGTGEFVPDGPAPWDDVSKAFGPTPTREVMKAERMTAADVVRAARRTAARAVPAGQLKEHRAWLDRYGRPDVKLVAYEWNWSRAYFGQGLPDAVACRQALAFRCHPESAGVYRAALDSLAPYLHRVCGFIHSYSSPVDEGGWAAYGMLARQGAAASAADGSTPGYPGLLDDLAGAPPGLADQSLSGSVLAMVLSERGGVKVSEVNVDAMGEGLVDYRAKLDGKKAAAADHAATAAAAALSKAKDDQAGADLETSFAALTKAIADAKTAALADPGPTDPPGRLPSAPPAQAAPAAA